MVECRSFRNTDPPHIAHLWNQFWGTFGNGIWLTPLLLERFVLAKLFFDPAGLILAFDDGRPVGFVHAGFGPNDAKNGLDPAVGVICAIVALPGDYRAEVMQSLIQGAEAYLTEHGATTIYCGGSPFAEPFWLGLAHGPRVPGIADNDLEARECLTKAGYRPVETRLVLDRSLRQFTVPPHPEIFKCHRDYVVVFAGEPRLRQWWELTVLDPFEICEFDLVERAGSRPVGQARLLIREMAGRPTGPMPFALWDVAIEASCNNPQVKWFFMVQVARDLSRGTAGTMEVQVSWPVGGDEPEELQSLRCYLGMTPRFQGTVFVKELASSDISASSNPT